jgi:SAM-dependent methyltransferase
LDRKAKVLNLIDPAAQVGLEIGALNRPIVPREQGNVRFVDHAPTDQLREKYHTDANVDTDRLVDVDYVWGPETLGQAVGPEQRFDYVIASHVAEHVPDLIGWLREIHEVLEEGGILSLVIPDRRYTFDYLRQPSTTAQLIDAHLRENRRPTPGQVFDHFSRLVYVDLDVAWTTGVRPDRLRRRYTHERARGELCRAQESEAYIDVHCWVFTPSSFFSIIVDLIRLDLFDYTIVGFFPPAVKTNEFFVTLRAVQRSGGDRDAHRLAQLASVPIADSDLGLNADPRDVAAGLQMLTERQVAFQARMDQLLNQRQTETREFRDMMREKDRRIADLTLSTSWQVTAPFRWLASRLRR